MPHAKCAAARERILDQIQPIRLVMLKVLAGNLSVSFSVDGIDGRQLERYLSRQKVLFCSLCDQLLLHDQIVIPTHDYLTAAGLILFVGERNLISLLEEERLRFIRLRGLMGYIKGTARDGRLIAFNDPSETEAFSAPLEKSIDLGLAAVPVRLTEHSKLHELLLRATQSLELSSAVDATHRDAYADLRQTSLWHKEFDYPNADLIALPGIDDMQVRVIGPGTNVSRNIVDACLALGIMNIELYLAKELDCVGSATASPLGDCFSLKIPHLVGAHEISDRLWRFLDIANVPDLSLALLQDKSELAKFLKLTQTGDAVAFRRWFNENVDLDEKELIKRYVDLLRQIPWIDGGLSRICRMACSLGLGAFGLGLAVDAGMSVIDNFVVEKYLRGKGAKFFIESLGTFSGRLKGRHNKAD